MNIPVIVLLLQGIPEGTALATLAFVITRIPLNRKKILLIGTALAVCAYVVRLFPIPYGIHTILIIFILFIILTMLNKEDVGLSFLASLLSILALIILETACVAFIKPVLTITSAYHADRIIVGDIHVLLIFILAFYLNKIIH